MMSKAKVMVENPKVVGEFDAEAIEGLERVRFKKSREGYAAYAAETNYGVVLFADSLSLAELRADGVLA